MPTLLERAGNFSQTSVKNSQNRRQIFDPATGAPFANNTITAIDPAAKALLVYIPLPNLPGDTQNFHRVIAATNDSDNFNIRLVFSSLGGTSAGPRPGGPRNSLFFGFHYHGSHSNITNAFPSVGGSITSRDFDIPLGYVRTWGKLTNNPAL